MPEPFGPVTSRKPPVGDLDVEAGEDAPVAVALREPARADHGRKTSAAARWKPSGWPAAANVSAISSISPIQRQPFRAAERSAAQAVAQLGRSRQSPLVLDVEVPCDLVDREQHRRGALRPGGVGHLQRRRVRDDPRSRSHPANSPGDRRCVGTGEIERRARLVGRPADDAAVHEPRVDRRDLLRAHRRDRVRIDVDAVEAVDPTCHVERRVRRADREDQLRLGGQRLDRAGIAKARGARPVASLRPSDAHRPRRGPFACSTRPTGRPHLARVQQADDHRTSASTKAKNATEITPFIVKKAASSRRRSPGRTSECS